MKNYIETPPNKNYIKSTLILTSSSLVIVFIPLLIWKSKVPIIARTYDGSAPGMMDSQPFELFGLLSSIFLIVVAWINIKIQKKVTLKSLIPIILPLLVSLQILFILLEDSHPKSGDYLCYENAAQAIVNGMNPYTVYLKCYLYPPLQAQALALTYHFIDWRLSFLSTNITEKWNIVFYLYQCTQFIQIILAYYLTNLLAQKMGLKIIPSSLIVSALFLFNNPLFRTIKFNQINIWILNCFLLAVLWLPRHPFIAGLAVALGAHIKLYTFVLLLPWGLTRKWRSIVGILTGFLSILFVQTGFGNNLVLWQNFLVYFTTRIEKPSNYRNSSIWSFFYNLVKIPARFTHVSIFDFVPFLVFAINILIIIWFIIRIIKRERIYIIFLKANDFNISNSWNEIYRLYGHSIDAIALGLLISPSVWEHHYVIAIPIALWAIVACRQEYPLLVGIGIFLIFCLPTFDIFPLSHHRLLGLLILVFLTSPENTRRHFILSKNLMIS